MELGKRIAKIRKDNNLTQEQFAEKYYVTQQTVSHWENGKSYPDLDILVRISDDFGVSLDALMKGDKEMVKAITRSVRMEKYYRLALLGICAVIILAAVAAGIYIAAYRSDTVRTETKFKNGLRELGFTEAGDTEYMKRYETEIGGVRYVVPEPVMRDISSCEWGNMNKTVTAVIETDRTLAVGNAEGTQVIPYHIDMRITEDMFYIDVFRDDPQNEELYYLEYDPGKKLAENHGLINDGIDPASMSDMMRPIYEENREIIDTSFAKAVDIHNTLY